MKNVLLCLSIHAFIQQIVIDTVYVPGSVLSCYEGMEGKEHDREKEVTVAYLDHLWRFVKIEMPRLHLILSEPSLAFY